MQLVKRTRLAFAVAVAKTVTWIVRSLHLGAASVLPGAIASRIFPDLMPQLFAQVRKGVILVVGTNGKTTTSLLLKTIIANEGACVVHNASGANLLNGLITALLSNTNIWGQLEADYAILEVDENVLPLVLNSCQPQYILGLNLFRDQLDRYGEVDTISQRWLEAINPLPLETVVVLNADDPTLSYLGQQLPHKVLFFGLNEPELYLEEVPHAADSSYCPRCGTSLLYEGLYLSHLGNFNCPNCGFQRSDRAINSQEWSQILIGVYNKYNTIAAGLLAQEIGISRRAIDTAITNFRAAFGRAEELRVNNRLVRILLSKNPVGMNETIRAVQQIQQIQYSSVTLVVLNDRTPDGTDVSWIWDVDLEKLISLGGTIVVSGDRLYDMALRLNYSSISIEFSSDYQLIIKENLKAAVTEALEITPVNGTLHILPTYSAMLEVRQILTGSKIN